MLKELFKPNGSTGAENQMKINTMQMANYPRFFQNVNVRLRPLIERRMPDR